MFFSAPLPAPREYGWKLKSVGSAKTTVRRDAYGGVDVTIEHDLIRGITTEMLGWWFQHMDDTVQFRDAELQAYLLWHPYDHVSIEFGRDHDGRVVAGETVHIHEVFARNPKFRVNGSAGLHRWDDRGIGLHIAPPGPGAPNMFQLDHEFRNVDGGVRYHSHLHLGLPGMMGSLFNSILLPFMFDDDKVVAWLRHNVEEVGNFENFLPELHAAMN